MKKSKRIRRYNERVERLFADPASARKYDGPFVVTRWNRRYEMYENLTSGDTTDRDAGEKLARHGFTLDGVRTIFGIDPQADIGADNGVLCSIGGKK